MNQAAADFRRMYWTAWCERWGLPLSILAELGIVK